MSDHVNAANTVCNTNPPAGTPEQTDAPEPMTSAEIDLGMSLYGCSEEELQAIHRLEWACGDGQGQNDMAMAIVWGALTEARAALRARAGAASPASSDVLTPSADAGASVERMAAIWRLWADQNEPSTDAERAAVSFARHIQTLTKCCGRLRLTDGCYGMTDGRRYDCEKCGSYVVVKSPDSHPEFCNAPLAPVSPSASIAVPTTATQRTDVLSRDDVLSRLREEIERAGSQRAWARRVGVSPAYVSDVLAGHRDPGESILTPLGLTVSVRYERIYRPEAANV